MRLLSFLVLTVLFFMWFTHIKNCVKLLAEGYTFTLDELCSNTRFVVPTTATIKKHYTFNYSEGSQRLYEGHVLLTYNTLSDCHYECLMYVNKSRFADVPRKWMKSFYPVDSKLEANCNSRECYYDNLYCNNSVFVKPIRYEL